MQRDRDRRYALNGPRPAFALGGESLPGFALSVTPDLIEAIATRVAELLESRLGRSSEGWIGVEDAAAHLACKPQRIYDLVSQRRLPFRRDGRRVLFRRSDLDGYLEAEGPGA